MRLLAATLLLAAGLTAIGLVVSSAPAQAQHHVVTVHVERKVVLSAGPAIRPLSTNFHGPYTSICAYYTGGDLSDGPNFIQMWFDSAPSALYTAGFTQTHDQSLQVATAAVGPVVAESSTLVQITVVTNAATDGNVDLIASCDGS